MTPTTSEREALEVLAAIEARFLAIPMDRVLTITEIHASEFAKIKAALTREQEAPGAVVGQILGGDLGSRYFACPQFWTVPLGTKFYTTPPPPVAVRGVQAVGYVTDDGATFYTEQFGAWSLKPKPGVVLYTLLPGQPAGVEYSDEELALAQRLIASFKPSYRAALQAALGGGGGGE